MLRLAVVRRPKGETAEGSAKSIVLGVIIITKHKTKTVHD